MLELTKLDSTIKLDIRYARNDNFVGRPVYSEARAFLQPVAAHALIRVNKKLRKKGAAILVFDGYRPWSVTKLFWDVVTDDQRPYVADPAVGSRHNRGCAVDVGLYNIDTGIALSMPSEFDEFNSNSHINFKGGSEIERANRDLLREAMESESFFVNPLEWWHFDHSDWEKYEILDVPLDQL